MFMRLLRRISGLTTLVMAKLRGISLPPEIPATRSPGSGLAFFPELSRHISSHSGVGVTLPALAFHLRCDMTRAQTNGLQVHEVSGGVVKRIFSEPHSRFRCGFKDRLPKPQITSRNGSDKML